MSANLLIHRDPFRSALNVETSEILHGKTIFETLINTDLCATTENGIIRLVPFYVLVNGLPVLQKDWNTILQDDDVLQITLLPKGGGGGGSNIGSILAAVAMAVLAYFTMGLSLVAAAAVGVGTLAVMSLATSAVPAPSTSLSNSARESTSPTYSLNAQSNTARLLEAIPRVYGKMNTTPDLATQPYNEFQGNEQYLYQLFVISLGQVEVDEILIDGTSIDKFSDATYEIIPPGGVVTLFPDNVVSSESVQQLSMLGPNNPTYHPLGPYVSAPAGTKANFLAVDVALPRGAATMSDEGNKLPRSVSYWFEYRLIDDAGSPLSGWKSLVQGSVTLATSNPQIYTHKVEVPEGRYEVQGARSSNESGDSRSFDDLQWIGMRAYLTSTYTYGNVTLLAVAMRATNALNSSTARRFTVTSRGLVQTWNPVDGWGPYVYSNNPAWIAADILRDKDYGRGLGTDRLNITKFHQLSKTWATRGDSFNGVFDTTVQLWDALTKVCRVGRAVPIYYAGVIDIIRDEPRSIPTAQFSAANMVMGSFKTTYNFFSPDTPDHIVVEYLDPVTWKPATVACKLPGEPELNPLNIELFGCTDRDQAWREGISMVAANRDRRRDISFSCLAAGLVPQYNGLVRISHDVPQWGYSGRVISLNRDNGRLRTTEPIPFDSSVVNLIAFRKRDGSEDGPYVMKPDPTTNDSEAVFGCIVEGTDANPLSNIYISDGVREDETFYQCGPTEKRGIKALVISAMPDAEGKVQLNCINYADSVHSAENGGIVPPPPPESNLPGEPSAPIINNVDVLYTVTVGQQNIVATAAIGAIYYEFQARRTDPFTDWALLGNYAMPTLISNLSPGKWEVRVRGIGRATGPWTTWAGVIEATTLPTATLDLFAAESGLFSIPLSWSFSAISKTIARSIQVWVGATNVLGDAIPLVTLPYPANSYVHTQLGPGERRYYWARVVDTAGRVGTWYNNAAPIAQVTSSSGDKILDQIQGQLNESSLGKDLLDRIDLIDGDGVGSVNKRLEDVKELLQDQIDQIGEITDALLWKPDGLYKKGESVRLGQRLFTARQDVPAGTTPPNDVYWEDVGSLSQTVNGFASQINKNTADVKEVDGKVTAQAGTLQSLQASYKQDEGDGSGALADMVNSWQTKANYSREVQVRTSENFAQVLAVTALESKVVTADNALTARITLVERTQVTDKQAVSEQISNVNASIQSQGQLINSQGQLINQYGQQIDASGKVIEQQGQKLNSQGQLINSQGELINAQGQRIDAQGQLIIDQGKKLDTTSAAVETASKAIVDINGKVDASYNIKVQANAGNKFIAAGVGIGISNESGVLQSDIILVADRVSIASSFNGTLNAMFSTEGGNVYMRSVFIQNGSINMLKIGDNLQSDDYVKGVSGWKLGKGGALEFNGSIAGGGRLTMSNQLVQVFDASGTLRVRLGIWG